MKINRTNLKRLVSAVCVVVVAMGMLSLWHNAEAHNRKKGKKAADLVRWDILSINPLPPAAGSRFSAGGEAFAFAYHTPGSPSAAWIRLTGGGTSVPPTPGAGSGEVPGRGT